MKPIHICAETFFFLVLLSSVSQFLLQSAGLRAPQTEWMQDHHHQSSSALKRWDLYCPQMCLDSSQQPIWRRDARLREVVPPPRFLLTLYPSLSYNWFTVAFKLVVGVKTIPSVYCWEEVVVEIRLYRNLNGRRERWRVDMRM